MISEMMSRYQAEAQARIPASSLTLLAEVTYQIKLPSTWRTAKNIGHPELARQRLRHFMT
jgi:hypothetical protein